MKQFFHLRLQQSIERRIAENPRCSALRGIISVFSLFDAHKDSPSNTFTTFTENPYMQSSAVFSPSFKVFSRESVAHPYPNMRIAAATFCIVESSFSQYSLPARENIYQLEHRHQLRCKNFVNLLYTYGKEMYGIRCFLAEVVLAQVNREALTATVDIGEPSRPRASSSLCLIYFLLVV